MRKIVGPCRRTSLFTKQLCGKKGCSGGDLSGFISSTVKTLVIDPVKSGVHLAADVVKNKVVREIATVGLELSRLALP